MLVLTASFRPLTLAARLVHWAAASLYIVATDYRQASALISSQASSAEELWSQPSNVLGATHPGRSAEGAKQVVAAASILSNRLVE
ncbi:hypothetical protein [Bradyrhizobium sp. CCBAU 53380]|uniref:hypothetical protein n=1 Tax=Bradyrhizobium sp. CCBAU 53380 TaxID=1325117 RepID=UPI002302CF66|nr:hypothetical protein [Bradyrhizobium sp. CCBAU 53380]